MLSANASYVNDYASQPLINELGNVSVSIEGQLPVLPPPFYYSFLYRIIGTIAAGLTLSVGLAGNLLVIIVIMWSSKMRTPTNCYLVSLSCSDMLFLLNATAPLLWELYAMIQEWALGVHACRVIVAVQYLSVDASSLSMAAFSVERWVAICHPMRSQTLCSVNRALKIIAGIWIFCIAYNVVWLFTLDIKTVAYQRGTYQMCTFKYSRGYYGTVYLLDLVLFYALPLGLIFVMYLQITFRLFLFHKPIYLLRKKHARDAENNGQMVRHRMRPLIRESKFANAEQLHNRMYISDQFGSRRRRSRKQVVKMLMVVVVLFAIFWLPYRAWVVYNSFVVKPIVDYWFSLFAKTMAYMNSALNPILYNAMSKKFRKSFRGLLIRSNCNSRQFHCEETAPIRQTNETLGNNPIAMRPITSSHKEIMPMKNSQCDEISVTFNSESNT